MKKYSFIQLKQNTASTWPGRSNNKGSLQVNTKEQYILVVPGIDVLVKQIQLPKKRVNKARTSIPYLLENQLSQKIVDLHFCAGISDKDGKTDVAIVKKSKISNWLEQCKKFEIFPYAVVTEQQLLSKPENNSWNIIQLSDRLIIRTWNNRFFTTDLSSAKSFFATLEENQYPENIKTYLEDPEYKDKLVSLFPFKPTIEFADKASDLLDLQLSTKTINLLQGEFDKDQSDEKTNSLWIAASGLLLLFVALLTGSTFYKNKILLETKSQLINEIKTAYQRTFPESKRIVNPLAQTQHQLKLLEKNDSKDNENLFKTVETIGKIIKNSPMTSIERFHFREKLFSFELKTKQIKSIEDMKNQLIKNNFNAEIQGTSRNDDEIKSTINITLK